jgi:hypothetical protein
MGAAWQVFRRDEGACDAYNGALCLRALPPSGERSGCWGGYFRAAP